MPIRSLLPLALLLVCAAAARAELQWEKTLRDFERAPDAGEVEARYAFRNAGAVPVTIKSLRSSCGCTTAHLEKKTYAPGESGEVALKFIIGDRRGVQVKGVTVTTDDPAQPPKVLVLRVNIFDPVRLAPELVWWRVGEAAAAKTVEVSVDPARPVRVKSVASSNPRIAAKLETRKAGEEFAVSIKPADTAAKETAEIRVLTDFPADAPRSYVIHARIK